MESKLQSKVKRDLRRRGWKVIKVSISEPGQPDLLAGKSGKAIFIEMKDSGKKAKQLQQFRHREWRAHGFAVFVIDSWEQYQEVIENL